MRLLLDTHASLWFVADDPKLSPIAKALIEDPTNEPWLSIASPWEMAIKLNIGRLTLGAPLLEFLNEQSALNLTQMLPITLEHAAKIASLPPHHHDPFDRMMISQSIVDGFTIVSADREFDAYSIERRW